MIIKLKTIFGEVLKIHTKTSVWGPLVSFENERGPQQRPFETENGRNYNIFETQFLSFCIRKILLLKRGN